jgi:ketosteroid isomerase-like protein
MGTDAHSPVDRPAPHERVDAAPDGRVVIVMSTHMRGKGSGIPLAERVAHVWEFKDEKLWRARLYRDPAEALAVAGLPLVGPS